MTENEKVLYKALEQSREYARFNHKSTAWHNDNEAYHLIRYIIEPALKKVNPNARTL